MSCLFCPLCNTLKDSDFVGCHELETGTRRELICGDCYERLPEFFPPGERDGVFVDGKPVPWEEWE